MDVVRIDEERCSLCGLCIPICVRRILDEGDEAVRVTDPALCILCGHCKAVCPEDAPQLPSLNSNEFEPVPRREDLPGPDQLMGLFRSRRSVRIFKKDPVEREKIERIVQAGRFAPTGGNRQGLYYTVVWSPERLEAVRLLTIDTLLRQAEMIEEALARQRKRGEPLSEPFQVRQVYAKIWREMGSLYQQGVDRLFYHAPAVVVCHVDPLASTSPDVDAGLAAMQMVLMAEALGLGTCFCGFLIFAIQESQPLREALQLPEAHRVPLAFMLGYPDVCFIRLVSRNPARVSWIPE